MSPKVKMLVVMILLLMCWQGIVNGVVRPKKVQVKLDGIREVDADCYCEDMLYTTWSTISVGTYTLEWQPDKSGEHIAMVWECNIPAVAEQLAFLPGTMPCEVQWAGYRPDGRAYNYSAWAKVCLIEFSEGGFQVYVEGIGKVAYFYGSYSHGDFGYLSKDRIENKIQRDTGDCNSPITYLRLWLGGRGGFADVREVLDLEEPYFNFGSWSWLHYGGWADLPFFCNDWLLNIEEP